MRVYVGTDIEGVAGVVSFGVQTRPEGTYYEAAKRLLTAEVNAAIEAMVEMGVEEILVDDGHGPGAMVFEELHAAARLLHGRPLGPRSVRDHFIAEYDVCVMIGQHAMAGTATGNMNHTQNSSSIDYYQLDGRPIGEIAQFALYQGALGLPMIFLSGDEAACREAEELIPGVVTASVKHGLGRNSAISLSAPQAHARIRAGIEEALGRHAENPMAPLVWPGPHVLEKRFFHTDAADAAATTAGAERVDAQTVRFRGDEIRDIIYR